MKQSAKIVESVNFISEEDLLVQELDKRLSFDMLGAAGANKAAGCVHCDSVCSCLIHKDIPCSLTSTCGVRG